MGSLLPTMERLEKQHQYLVRNIISKLNSTNSVSFGPRFGPIFTRIRTFEFESDDLSQWLRKDDLIHAVWGPRFGATTAILSAVTDESDIMMIDCTECCAEGSLRDVLMTATGCTAGTVSMEISLNDILEALRQALRRRNGEGAISSNRKALVIVRGIETCKDDNGKMTKDARLLLAALRRIYTDGFCNLIFRLRDSDYVQVLRSIHGFERMSNVQALPERQDTIFHQLQNTAVLFTPETRTLAETISGAPNQATSQKPTKSYRNVMSVQFFDRRVPDVLSGGFQWVFNSEHEAQQLASQFDGDFERFSHLLRSVVTESLDVQDAVLRFEKLHPNLAAANLEPKTHPPPFYA